MKKSVSVKHLLVGFFAAVGCACTLFSVSQLPTVSGSAATESAAFEMLGASVRKKSPDGMRFVAQIDGDTFASYGAGKKYGMMIVPEDLADEVMTVAYTGGKYVASDTDAIVIEGGELWSDTLCEKYGVADGYEAFSCALVAGQGEEDEIAHFPASMYNRPLTAVAFVIPENASTVYTQKMTRSISYVAMLESMSAGYEVNEDNEAVENILDGVSVAFSVNGGNPLQDKTAVAPTFTFGGVAVDASPMVTVSYQSSNEAVAKIVDGKVVAVADGNATITATATVAGGKSYTATASVQVSLAKYTIMATAGTGGVATEGGTYVVGDTVTLTATAHTGYLFDGWYENDNKVSGNATYTFTATADRALTAKFVAQKFVVSATQNYENGGTITGAGEYAYGTQAVLTATAASGYAFIGWYDGETKIGDNATYAFWVADDKALTAKFSAKITIDTGLWTISNPATTVLSDKTITVTSGWDSDYIGTTATDYENFLLEYDLTCYGTTFDNGFWIGVAFGGTAEDTYYGHNPLLYLWPDTINALNCTLEGANVGGGRVWYPVLTPETNPVLQGPRQGLTALHMKLLVQDGVAMLTTTFTTAESGEISVTATTAKLPSTLGRVYIPLPGANCVIDNLSIIDLNGRDLDGSTGGGEVVETVSGTISALAEANQVKIDGRTHYENNALVLRNSASGFEVYTTSSSLTMSASVSPLFDVECMKIKVWVDGVEKVLDLTSLPTTATTVVLAENMQAGVRHHIKVAKMTEPYLVNAANAAYGNLYIHGLACLSDGVIERAPAASELRLEVYGDSITCGYGALGSVTTNPTVFDPAEEDATVTYAYKTAMALGADINVIAHQGWAIGQSRWTDESNPLTLPAIYDKVTDAHNIAWDFSSYTPDIVIINLGTNDHIFGATVSAADPNYTNFCWQYLAFLHALHGKYPNAKFALCYGMMTPAGDAVESAIKDWLTSACRDGIYDSTNGVWVYQPIDNVISVDLTGADDMYKSGGGSHPSAAEHALAADNLLAALRNAGWVS